LIELLLLFLLKHKFPELALILLLLLEFNFNFLLLHHRRFIIVIVVESLVVFIILVNFTLHPNLSLILHVFIFSDNLETELTLNSRFLGVPIDPELVFLDQHVIDEHILGYFGLFALSLLLHLVLQIIGPSLLIMPLLHVLCFSLAEVLFDIVLEHVVVNIN